MLNILKKSISYAILFRLIEGLFFAPLMGWVGQILRGQTVVDSTALIVFFLSPRGFFVALISIVSLLLIRITEQAGLSILRAEEFGGPVFSPMHAFTFILDRMARLLRVSLRFILLIGGMLAPFLIVTGVVARTLLSRHDINFYLAQRPPDFLMWTGLLVGFAFITLTVILWNMVRWRWVLHVILFEQTSVGDAFKRSAQLAKGRALKIAMQWGAIGALNLGLGAIAGWSGRFLLPLGVSLMGESVRSLGVLLGSLLVFQAFLAAIMVMAGPVVEALIFTRGYFNRSGLTLSGPLDHAPPPSRFSIRVPSWAYAAMVLAFIGVGGVVGGLWGTQALSKERPVKIIAHKGSVNKAPENSLPAIERAILEGADVAEIDVQASQDGVVVLAHDSDFSRMAGLAKKVSDLTWDEIKKIDIGSGLGAEFVGVTVPRLEQVLDLARNRIGLNIELKHYGGVDGKLETQVVDIIHRYGVVDQVEIQSLDYDSLMTIRRLDPGIKVGYLFSVNARDPAELQVDFLSVQASRVDARLLRKAHRTGKRVYVWTVDTVDQMKRMIDLGVDGLITNESHTAVQLLRDWRAMSPQEKALHRVRAWLAH